MNTYSATFTMKCPTNGIPILYHLRIESLVRIQVERINQLIYGPAPGVAPVFHEEIADRLAILGGKQTLTAHHHGVTIETTR